MICAVTMVKDEADVIGPVLRHLVAEGVDHIIVADNLSTDETPAILAGLQDERLPIDVVPDEEVAFLQAEKMTRLARAAYHLGATWVLPFDADEVWYSPTHDTIAAALAEVPEDRTIVRAPGWDHIWRAGPDVEGTQSVDLGDRIFYWHPALSPWRRPESQKLAKVAFRAHPDAVMEMGNHDVDRPGLDMAGPLAFRHFQYRSLEQMTRKLRNGREAYEATDLHPAHGTHWRSGGLKSDADLARDWAELCATPGLVFDPAPLRVEVGA